MSMKKALLGATLVWGLAAGPAHAATVSYNIGWTGAGGYSLAGLFSFDDATAGSTVEAGDLISFFIEGFLGAASLGTFSGTPENFNFDALTGAFLVGGLSGTSTGQEWNFFDAIAGSAAPGIGFGSGDNAQLLALNGVYYLNSIIGIGQSTLTATPNLSAVPLPAALPLFAAGLSAMGFMGWRKRRKLAA
jgi:hypothetical protein